MLHELLCLVLASAFLAPGVLCVEPWYLLCTLTRVDLNHQITHWLVHIRTNPIEFTFDSLMLQKVWPLHKGLVIEVYKARVAALSFYLFSEQVFAVDGLEPSILIIVETNSQVLVDFFLRTIFSVNKVSNHLILINLEIFPAFCGVQRLHCEVRLGKIGMKLGHQAQSHYNSEQYGDTPTT